MMSLLLACILTFLPLMAWADTSAAGNPGELDPHSASNPPAPNDAKTADTADDTIPKLGLFGNPYSPASATNFEALTASYLYDP